MGSKASKKSGNDSDEAWANAFREKDKNDIYKWSAKGMTVVVRKKIF